MGVFSSLDLATPLSSFTRHLKHSTLSYGNTWGVMKVLFQLQKAPDNQSGASCFSQNLRKMNKTTLLLHWASWALPTWIRYAWQRLIPNRFHWKMNHFSKTESSQCGLKLQRNRKTKKQPLLVEKYRCLCFFIGKGNCFCH